MLKKYFLICFCVYLILHIDTCMSMLEDTESSGTKEPQSIVQYLQLTGNEKIEKSYIFNIRNKNNKKIIILKTNNNTRIIEIMDNIEKTVCNQKVSNNCFDNVEHIAPFVDLTTKQDTYSFFVAKKQPPTRFFTEKYLVQEIIIHTKSGSVKFEKTLFSHNTPIMYLNTIEKNKRLYVAAGSFYPSIKIYSLFKGKMSETLHNRFLLGTFNDTLKYAKKINTRPYFGFQRRLAYNLNAQYTCNFCSIIPFNDNEEVKISNATVDITFAKYPVMIDAKNNIFFDRKENKICQYLENQNKKTLFDLTELLEEQTNTKHSPNIYMENKNFFIQTEKSIYTIAINGDRETLKECYKNENTILNSYVANNKLFIITEQNIVSVDLPAPIIEQKK